MSAAAARVTTIDVAGMHCGGCERSLVTALQALPGVEAASADHIAEQVEVTHDPAVAGEAALRAAVESAGFIPR